jgi:hypothetical protein
VITQSKADTPVEGRTFYILRQAEGRGIHSFHPCLNLGPSKRRVASLSQRFLAGRGAGTLMLPIRVILFSERLFPSFLVVPMACPDM